MEKEQNQEDRHSWHQLNSINGYIRLDYHIWHSLDHRIDQQLYNSIQLNWRRRRRRRKWREFIENLNSILLKWTSRISFSSVYLHLIEINDQIYFHHNSINGFDTWWTDARRTMNNTIPSDRGRRWKLIWHLNLISGQTFRLIVKGHWCEKNTLVVEIWSSNSCWTWWTFSHRQRNQLTELSSFNLPVIWFCPLTNSKWMRRKMRIEPMIIDIAWRLTANARFHTENKNDCFKMSLSEKCSLFSLSLFPLFTRLSVLFFSCVMKVVVPRKEKFSHLVLLFDWPTDWWREKRREEKKEEEEEKEKVEEKKRLLFSFPQEEFDLENQIGPTSSWIVPTSFFNQSLIHSTILMRK